MILIKNITLRNFLSIGQVTQAVDFNKQELTLILGEKVPIPPSGFATVVILISPKFIELILTAKAEVSLIL